MQFSIEQYSPEIRGDWDSFVDASKNGTFLFRRGYMDYHSDRFRDCSLVARNEKGKIVALLPANADGEVLWSHAGLTFGGWIGGYKDFDVISLMGIQREANRFLHDRGFRELRYRPVPYIYDRYPAQEDRYVLFRNNARMEVSQVSIAVDLLSDAGPDAAMRRKARQAAAARLEIVESTDLQAYWGILSGVLQERYAVRPVHSLDEIKMLRERFPGNIRLFAATLEGEMLGGSLLYISGGVVHAQYIAASPEGKRLNALPLLFSELIEKSRKAGYRWFDFGTCNEQAGRYLNEGLARQKISFGGRAVAYEMFVMPIIPDEL